MMEKHSALCRKSSPPSCSVRVLIQSLELCVCLLSFLQQLPAFVCGAAPSLPFRVGVGFSIRSNWAPLLAPSLGTIVPVLSSPNQTYSFNLIGQLMQQGAGDGRSYTQVWNAAVQHTASKKMLWVSNRDTLVRDGCILELTAAGELVVMQSSSKTVAWSSESAGKGAQELQLLESGNLVLINPLGGDVVWQSFDHPTDTIVSGQLMSPGMKLSNCKYFFRKSDFFSDFSEGLYSMSMEVGDLLLRGVVANETFVYWSFRSFYDATHVPGSPPLAASYAGFSNGLSLFSSNSSVIIQSVDPLLAQNISAYQQSATLLPDGNLVVWYFTGGRWIPQFQALQQPCDFPNSCGTLGVCDIDRDGQCSCFQSFSAKNTSDWSQGCDAPWRQTICSTATSDFQMLQLSGYDYLPLQFLQNFTSSVDECSHTCLIDCTCTLAFHHRNSSSCFHIRRPLTIRRSYNNQYLLFVKVKRMPEEDLASPPSLASSAKHKQMSHSSLSAITAASAAAASGILIAFYTIYRRRNLTSKTICTEDETFLGSLPGLPPRFSYKDLQVATHAFTKRLGGGGFGSVYEGLLQDGSRVAVKQLEGSSQGYKQFRAEVATIGSISHLHLVRLQGFCMEASHRLLVYEFMPNGSLDKWIFPKGGRASRTESLDRTLDWCTRYSVALGVAKGLAYLHEQCSRRIIHCDIKPENILLDKTFRAKVSDFGLSKLMTWEQSYAVTTMRGTRGYLAPEWLLNAPITDRSDVYSFGMVLLELISGRRSLDLSVSPEKCYLPSWAFALLRSEEEKLIDMADQKLGELTSAQEQQLVVLVRISLWCIQEEVALRPSMAAIVKMLEGDLVVMPPPLSATFCFSNDQDPVSSL